MAADNVVLGIRAVLLVQAKLQAERVLAREALEVAVVELAEDEDEGGLARELDVELFVVLRLPGNLNADPALAAPPVGVSEEARAVKVLVLAKEVFVRDPEDAVAAKLVAKLLLDLGRPLFGTIGPGTLPDALFGLAPGVPTIWLAGLQRRDRAWDSPQFEQPGPVLEGARLHDDIGVTLGDALAVTIPTVQETSAASEQEFLVHLAEFIFPEPVKIKNVGRQQFGGDTAREVFQPLTDPSTGQGGVVTVRLCVGLFDERHPSFVLVLALREEEGLGARLVRLAIDALDILAVDLLEEIALQAGGVPAW